MNEFNSLSGKELRLPLDVVLLPLTAPLPRLTSPTLALQTLRMYWRRMDPDIPPEVDDGSQEDLETGSIEGKERESDPHNLEEKYYRYGIKPEWMQVHRIINHVQYAKTQFDYLVKWRELVYEQVRVRGDHSQRGEDSGNVGTR